MDAMKPEDLARLMGESPEEQHCQWCGSKDVFDDRPPRLSLTGKIMHVYECRSCGKKYVAWTPGPLVEKPAPPLDQAIADLLHKFCDGDNSHNDDLIVGGYICKNRDGDVSLTVAGIRVMEWAYPGVLRGLQQRRMQERAAAEANNLVVQGLLRIVVGRYRLTDVGKRTVMAYFQRFLKSREYYYHCGPEADLAGARVGQEHEDRTVNQQQRERLWRLSKRRIINSLTPAERHLLGLKAPKALSPRELELKNDVLDFCRWDEEKRLEQLRR